MASIRSGHSPPQLITRACAWLIHLHALVSPRLRLVPAPPPTPPTYIDLDFISVPPDPSHALSHRAARPGHGQRVQAPMIPPPSTRGEREKRGSGLSNYSRRLLGGLASPSCNLLLRKQVRFVRERESRAGDFFGR
jgi:hypothetical protein